ncbi:PQQ-dependent sugar dehydrogenase [Saccharothrix sp. S26]|uniref:PQQ-dependent sugar dehydrogenase n=1 Tax=Saccharothrix sp. S26 TaxID=2907215 RepID=UPI001F33F01C|nr:PQQ-dependent sugar dehydrogenase [Saccharothrix sp. S26]MCE6994644.1 PQQ-dependent sugar dehydrogenase [Saccharothrix sp. S26]
MAPRTRRAAPTLLGALATALAVVASTLVSAAPAGAAPVLLSQGKPATASSSGASGFAPSMAVDGNASTRWASQGGVDPSWISVDLGTTATITRVRLQWDLSCARAYRIETSPDATTWTTVFATSTGAGGVEDLVVGGTGRHVRVHGTTRCRTASYHGYSLQEFQVFGETGRVDTTPPSPPADLRSANVTPTSVDLAWNPATDDVGVTSYEVYRSGQFVKAVTGTSTTVTGLSPNGTFTFYVNAKDAAGNISQASNNTEVRTPPAQADTERPTPPMGVRVTGVTANSVSLTWTASTDNIGVTRYEVLAGGAKAGDATGTSATIGGLRPSTSYLFTVRAFDAVGNVSDQSTGVNATTTAGGDQVGAVTQLATDNDVPWGLDFLPDGSGVYSRRDAFDIVKLSPSGVKTTLGTVPNVVTTNGEGGLLGIEVSPTFASDNYLYVYHTAANDNRIVRIKVQGNALVPSSLQVLLTGIPRNRYHNGGRLRFGPDGKLYAGTGDGQNANWAQDLTNLGGKVLRLNPDGSAPTDNPFYGNGGNARYVWTYGHRNVQGLAFDAQGRLWQAELGNTVMDELNLSERGGNYGWPACEGTSGNCSGYLAPKRTWSTANASPSGIAIVNNALYVATLRGSRLYRLVISGTSVGSETTHFQGTYGRLRTVERAPDGSLWLTTSDDRDSVPNNSNSRILRVQLN